MPTCDIIVVGGSAGAIDAMQNLVRSFPADFPAAVLMVLHVSPDCPSILPAILTRAGALPAKHAEDGEPVRAGQIFIAPPDHHMTIQDGHLRVKRGPRENRHRPAIDPLFRTAARTFHSRVIGIILSGHLDDGAAGLHAIRSLGGVGIVQDPATAEARQMPQSALQYGGADYVLPKTEIGPQVVELVANCARVATKGRPTKTANTNEGVEENLEVSKTDEGRGTPSAFSCPECSGVLWELKDGDMVRFRCRVGHAYTMSMLADEHVDTTENALWAAMRALEEKAALATRLSETTTDNKMSRRLREQAQADRDHARIIRDILLGDGKRVNEQNQDLDTKNLVESKPSR